MKKEVALAILGLDGSDLSEEAINKAYRAAMKMNHPDRYANDEELRQHAERQSKLINEARQVLLSKSQDDKTHTDTYSGGPNQAREERSRESNARYEAYWKEYGSSNGGQREEDTHNGYTEAHSDTPHASSSQSPYEQAATSSSFSDSNSSSKQGCGVGCFIAFLLALFSMVLISTLSCSAGSGSQSSSTGSSTTAANKPSREVSYSSSSMGFSSKFPKKPDIEKRNKSLDSSGEKVKQTIFYGDRKIEFTYVNVYDAGERYLSFHTWGEKEQHEAMDDFLNQSFDSFDETLKQRGQRDEITYGNNHGYPGASLVIPCTYQATGSGERTNVFFYASCAVSYSKVYVATGVRLNEDSARKALGSFKLHDIVYKSKKHRFSAAFPETPTKAGSSKKSSPVCIFYSSGSTGDTDITITREKSMVKRFKTLTKSQQHMVMSSSVTNGMGYSLKKKGIKYSRMKGSPRATLVKKVKTRSGKRAYYYASFSVNNSRFYELAGIRKTKAEASKALKSFKML